MYNVHLAKKLALIFFYCLEVVAVFVTPSRSTHSTTVHTTTASETSNENGTKFIRLLLQPYPLNSDLLVLYFDNTS